MAEDPGEALALLADMTGAVDPVLRELARRLAGRVAVRIGGGAPTRTGPVTHWLAPGAAGVEGDLDLDASLDVVMDARRRGGAPAHLGRACRYGPGGGTDAGAVGCLLVDHSGSMGGARLATAALAASVVASRAPDDYCVVAFAGEAIVVKGLGEVRSVTAVIDDLLALRGHGPTDLTLGLDVARRQLAHSLAPRQAVVLLSDCRANIAGDPLPPARWADQLVVLAPAGDSDEAGALARACGGRCAEVAKPMDVPAALVTLLT